METLSASARRITKALRHVSGCKAKLVAAENELDAAMVEQQRTVDRIRFGITKDEVADLAAQEAAR
jgi:hypothetical protein